MPFEDDRFLRDESAEREREERERG